MRDAQVRLYLALRSRATLGIRLQRSFEYFEVLEWHGKWTPQIVEPADEELLAFLNMTPDEWNTGAEVRFYLDEREFLKLCAHLVRFGESGLHKVVERYSMVHSPDPVLELFMIDNFDSKVFDQIWNTSSVSGTEDDVVVA